MSKNILLDLNYEAHISDFDMVIIRQLLKSWGFIGQSDTIFMMHVMSKIVKNIVFLDLW